MQSEVMSGQGRDDKVQETGASPAGSVNEAITRLTLNGRAIEWAGERISEAELRARCLVLEDEVLVIERDGEHVDILAGEVIVLIEGKTHHVHTDKHLITVYYENQPREIHRGVYTTEKLKHLFGVQDGYILEVINEEGQLTPLKPHAKLRVKAGMRFFEQVPCGGSA
jgi:hypothetical protein